VAELRGRFGAVHVAELLTGAATARLAALGHDRLGAYGRLKGARREHVRAWIDQLTARGHPTRAEGEYPTVALTKTGAAALRGEVPLNRQRNFSRRHGYPKSSYDPC